MCAFTLTVLTAYVQPDERVTEVTDEKITKVTAALESQGFLRLIEVGWSFGHGHVHLSLL